MSDYDRIAEAISFIVNRVDSQPTLQEIAGHLHLSPFHLQRLFCRWAGVTPKRFLQVLTLERAKQLLSEPKPLLEVSGSLGLSSGSRLYDHFVQLEAVTPGEFKQKGAGLRIEYAIHPSRFGEIFIATTPRGICRLAFLDHDSLAGNLTILHKTWPSAEVCPHPTGMAALVGSLFEPTSKRTDLPLSLHVTGTNFQISVWKALLHIPAGTLSSYTEIAAHIDHPTAVRAVGSAIGKNPVAFLIPCHRVIQKCGGLGGYRWGNTRKHALHAWETAQID